ncbi:MAG: htrA 2 [Chthonomonadaceae bacterium]|nr:htrA 2 [Chthonomonadaceae bacterium]
MPYRLAGTEHLLVRAKLNGTGPYNFILDTGAPALFVSADIADKIGVKPAADGWGVFDRLEVEGGAVLEKMKARIESPMQLKGMNAMGLAGVRIDGVFGFNLLVNFRIEIDLTQPKMIWTRQQGLTITPISAKEAGNTRAVPTEGITQMENLTKMASALFAQKKMPPPPVPRGFFGMEFAPANSDAAQVTAILAGSPAAQAGFKIGDKITALAIGADPAVDVTGAAELVKQAATVAAGTTVRFTVQRNGSNLTIPVVAGQGGI